MQHVLQALLLKMALKFGLKFTERRYLSNGSRDGVVSSSAIYSEAPLILSSFCEGRAHLPSYLLSLPYTQISLKHVV